MEFSMTFVRTLALSASMAICGWSQSTWKDLQFGSTIAAVKEQLQKAGVAAPGETTTTSAGITLLQTNTQVDQYTGKVLLRFSKDRSILDLIAINFSDSEPVGTGCKMSTDRAANILLMFKNVSDLLVQKYGQPATSTGWPSPEEFLRRIIATPLAPNSPDRIWKLNGQSIQEKADFMCKSLFITIVYKPIPNAL
jgi:hypothetical protein